MNGIITENGFVKEYEFNKPQIDEVDYLLDKVVKDSRMKSFHTIKHRCVYKIEFASITNNAKVILKISHDRLEFKSEYYGLNKKIKKQEKMVFYLNN